MNTKVTEAKKTIMNWDEAIPLGNGDMGCLIWNTSDALRFSIDKGGIWDCSDPPENQENFTYADLKQLVKNKNQRKIRKKYDDCYGRPTPTKLPAGKIIIDTGVRENVVSRLELLTACAEITAGDIKIKSFIHSGGGCGYIEINSENISYRVENPPFGDENGEKGVGTHKGITQGLSSLHYKKADFINEKEGDLSLQYFVQPATDLFYGIFSGIRKKDGKSLIAYTVLYDREDNFREKGREIIKEALDKGFDKAFAEHRIYWDNFWSKGEICLPDKELEKCWYINTYLLGAGSRKNCFPMPLQGVWTADNGSLPPWKGDYHHDLNTQMTYTSYLAADRLPEGECFIDYLLSMSGAGEKFAESFYGVKGLCLPSVMDIEGHALGGWPQYALSPTNQLWLAHIMTRYYFFTENPLYLDKICTYCEKTGTFLMNILEEKNGVLKLPLSTSPEINDNRLSAYLTPNTNYDLSLMQSFMKDTAELYRRKGDSEKAELWEKRFSMLEEQAVDSDNVLMLSPDKRLKESHRHHAHCMSIYPLRTLPYTTEKNRKIIDATVKDLEKLGVENWVGYSSGWMAQFYIIQGRGKEAAELLRSFFRYNCTGNGFHINGDPQKKVGFGLTYRVFTLEGNFLAADAIQNMLLYSEQGEIKLFPAIPPEWKDVSFRDMRAWGGLLVSAEMKEGQIKEVKIYGENPCSFNLSGKEYKIKKGETLYIKP